MKVAIVHDWLTGMRGGERVLEVLCRIFPEAPVFTLFHFPGTVSPLIESHQIITSRLQKWLWKKKSYRMFLPFFPGAIENFDLSDFDLVVSSSHAVAKSAPKAPGAFSVCYCHTPMRYIWDMFDEYFSAEKTSPLVRMGALLIRDYLQYWDRTTADRVDMFIANSRFVASRIRKVYQREAVVIPPPVDTSFYTPDGDPPDDFYLIVSALAPYKRLDTAVEAFNRLNKRLVIIGDGPLRGSLESLAGETVELIGYRPDEEVRMYYRRCKALVFPGIEDFGLTPLEAQACGRPVLAYGEGGVLESVVEGFSGHFYHDPSPEGLIQGIEEIERMTFSPDLLRKRALEYDIKVMEDRLRSVFNRVVTKSVESIQALTERVDA